MCDCACEFVGVCACVYVNVCECVVCVCVCVVCGGDWECGYTVGVFVYT